MVGRDLGADPAPADLGVRDGLHRGGAAEVLKVHARVLVHRQLGVARDHRGLAHARYPADAQRRADGALVHRTAVGQRRVLLVQADHPAAQPLVLQRLAQHPGAGDGTAVVGEPERALLAQLGHLGQLPALQPARDRRQEADRDARFARGRVAQRSQQRRGVDHRVGVRHRDHRAESPGRGCAGAASRGPPCAPVRACAGGRAGRQNAGSRCLPRPSTVSIPSGPSEPARLSRARLCVRRARARHGARRCPRAGRATCTSRSSSSAGELGPWMSGFAGHYASWGSGTGPRNVSAREQLIQHGHAHDHAGLDLRGDHAPAASRRPRRRARRRG